MFLFQPPPPTQYDLRFAIAGIPVRVHPLFWLIALLLGSSGDVLQIPIWVVVVFISILIHELGHALAFRSYGQRSQIVLHFAGGLTIPEPVSWGFGRTNDSPTRMQQNIISLAGPFAGFTFAALVLGGVMVSGGTVLTIRLFGLIPLPISPILPFGGMILNTFVGLLLWVNIFWGMLNLVPVYPLDGGQVTRNIFVQFDPWGGVRKSLWVSVIVGGLVAVAGLLLLRSIFFAILFGFLAFQNYQSLNA